MIKRGNIDTIIAIQDQFVNNLSHFWHWQLSPDPGETNITLGNGNNVSTFIIRGRNGSWLKGWLYNNQNAIYNNIDEVLRIIKYGFSANFKIAMALGMGTEPFANRTATGINIDDKPSIVIISIASILIGLAVLIIIGILLRKRIRRNNRVSAMLKTKTNVS
ncbi:unnamed protein product [Rotaria sp. Silwood2]|nr:unnamed protein product [Rotaria sp. Silwood2]CAF2738897.1 unnamed protein product [Rotaria sp. Silwood2]